MLPWIHSICLVHHRSSHEYLRVVTVRGEGKGETMVTTPDRLDRFSYINTKKNLAIHDDIHMTFSDFVIDHTASMTNCQISS
jgi:hypothetical protein